MLQTAAAAGLPDYTARDSRGAWSGPEMQQLSLRQILQIIRRHRLLLALVIGISVTLAVTSQLLTPPVYEATALVQVELNGDGANQADVATRNQQRVANEARTYDSPALALAVVRDLRLIHDHRLMGDAAIGPKKTSETAEEAAALKLQGMTSVSSNAASDFIDITVRSANPKLAAEIANGYVTSLQQYRLKQRARRKQRVWATLNSEAHRLGARAVAAEQAVAQYRREHNLPVGAGGPEDYAQFNRIEAETASALGMRAASAARSVGESRAAGMRTTAGATSPLLQQQQQRLDSLLADRARLSVIYGPNYPELSAVDGQIAEVRANMRQERARVIAANKAQIAADAARERALAQSVAAADAARAGALGATLDSLRTRTAVNTSSTPELARLEREADVARQAFLTIAQRAAQVQAEPDTTGVNSSLVSPAVPPVSPVSPAPKKAFVLSLIGSAMLGMLLVFAVELVDNKLRTGDQIRRLFGLPTLAMIPDISGSTGLTPEESPVLRDPQSLFAEVSRQLAAEVQLIGPETGAQSVLITSPLPGDGKSTVALSLVAAAAALGRKAVLVDLDLRKPGMLHKLQRTLNTPDLVDYLTDRADVHKMLPPPRPHAAREIETHPPVVLSTREPVRDPASLMRLGRLRTMFGALREQFDLIVINAPATLAVRDARTMADVADTTLMVVRWGSTTIEQMRAATQLLQNRIDGVIFNRVDYAEHARRGYGDSVQFYHDSASYYSDPVPRRRSALDWLRRLGNLFRPAAA